MPSLLVLGGSNFVGRAVVDAALDRGWDVTTFNRTTGTVRGDRLRPETLAPLAEREWDRVVDTWSGAPRAVRDAGAVLRGRAATYAYVSSCSVYADPYVMGMNEAAPVVDGSPDQEGTWYGEDKRGGELAALAAFGDDALLARCGLILGPHEDVGRLPWWLTRIARGDDVLAPGPPELELQLVDARDLAVFLLETDARGPVNVDGPPGQTTMGGLLEACVAATGSGARLRWTDPDVIAAAGIEPWSDLPGWFPPGHEYAPMMHGIDVTRALGAGLRSRPVEDTVRDTWAWMQALDGPPPQRADRPPPGVDPDKETAALHGL